MNKISKIFIGLVSVMALASCAEEAVYTTSPFVRFDSATYEVQENAGVIDIPVLAYPLNADLSFPREGATTTVTFEVIENTATKGDYFTVEPANGVLTFDNASKANIKVTVTDKSGEFTGPKDFKIKITSASDGYTIGGTNVVTFKIVDLDHPLAAILGTYDVTAVEFSSGSFYYANYEGMELKPYEGDVTKVICTGINAFAFDNNDEDGSFDAVGTVSADMKTISFAPQQFKPADFSGYGPVSLLNTDLVLNSDGSVSVDVKDEPIVFTATETGFIAERGASCKVELGYFFIGIGSGTSPLLGIDVRTVWTKK